MFHKHNRVHGSVYYQANTLKIVSAQKCCRESCLFFLTKKTNKTNNKNSLSKIKDLVQAKSVQVKFT